MGNLNYIVFGGVDSRDYGIYISGEGVFNAPERDVEVVNIPGKDGDLLIDRGRFLNIQVTYPGFNFEPDLSTFAERLRAFRAALASQTGYQRLEDSFHPDEFRLASFRSGLDVNPIMYNTASTFDIVFDCKPQRFLKSGEEEITIGEWGETETITGNIATFEGTDTTAIKSVVAQIVPKQEGSGDPSPTNVRPISGWSGVEVNHSGKNLLDLLSHYKMTNEGGVTFIVNDDGTITANGTPDGSGTPQIRWRFTGAELAKFNGMIINGCPNSNCRVLIEKETSPWTNFASDSGNGAVIHDIPDDPNYNVVVIVRVQPPNSVNNVVFKPMIRLATVMDDTYEPYQGQTITKSLGRTVYGGTLDVVSGKLVIDRAFKQVAPTDTMRMVGDICQVNYAPPSDNAWQNLICSHFPTKSIWSGTTNEGIGCWSGQFYFRWLAIGTTIEAWRQFFTDNNVQFTYTLATPIEVTLTPTEVKTLLGNNNIWADSGEVSVEIGENPNILVNPTPFEALPLFEVVGTGSLTVGNTTIGITGDSTQDIFIDSDIMEAYEDDNGAIISRNDRISLSGMNFPTLGTDTGITYTGLTSVTVTPRWWTI